jgi:hypothetical protein
MGDWTTTDCQGLRSLEQVTDDFCRSGNRLLGKNNNLVKALKADLKPVFAKRNNMEVMKAFRKLPQGLTDAQKAEKILEFAKSMPDKEFNEWMMKNLKGLKGEARIKAIMEMPKRFADHKIADEVLDVVKRYSDDLAGRTGRIFQRMGYDGVMRKIDWEKLKSTTKAWKTAKGIGDPLKSGVVADEAVKATSLVKRLKQITANSRVVKLYDSLRVKYNGKIESISQNLAKDAGNTFKNVYTPEALKSLPNVSSSKTVIGALQEVTLKDGSKKMVLSIPIENYASGIRVGLNVGVMTFIFSEGATIYQFARGDITQEDFYWETGKNCSAALLGGSATFVAVALGATPAGWVVMGLGVGTYMICDITFKGLRAAIDGPGFKLEDIMGQFPTEFQKRRSAIDFEGVDALFEYSGNVSILDYHGHDSLFENKSGNPSMFDAEGKNGLFDL